MVAHLYTQPFENTVSMSQAEIFLSDQLPQPIRNSIPTTLRNAYKAADAYINETPFLHVKSAKDNRGRIISWAVDHAFETLVESGQWGNATCQWNQFNSPTGHYLEIVLGHSVLTISQIKNPNRQPRDARFRQNKRFNNQLCLNFENHKKNLTIDGRPHILLLHGYQSLSFSYLAVPNEDHQLGYVYKTPNLMLQSHQRHDGDVVPAEDTNTEAVMTLKEDINRWEKNSGQL